MDYPFELVKTKSEVLDKCEKSVQLFLKDFSPDDIFYDGEFEPSDGSTDWDKHGTIKHYKSIRDNNSPRVFLNPYPFNAQQGFIGDCWLLAPLMTIARRRSLLEQILPNHNQKYSLRHGIFLVRLFFNEKWEVVVVDGHFPIRENNCMWVARLIYRELWPCIIEKAVAKLFGGYHKLRANKVHRAFRIITGASCEAYLIHFDGDLDLLWKKLKEILSLGFLMACSPGGGRNYEIYKSMNLSVRHPHAILNLSIHNGHRLVQLGCTNRLRWNGKWSDLPAYDEQTIKQFKNWEFEESKSQMCWIELGDFRQWFGMLIVCRYREGWEEIRINGHRQIGDSDGDKIFRIHVRRTSLITVEITLNQPSPPKSYVYMIEVEHDVGFICVHSETPDGKLGDLITTFPVKIRNNTLEWQIKSVETDPFYLERGSYFVLFVHVSEIFSKNYNWVVRSPTIENISHNFKSCDFQKLSYLSLQLFVLKYGKQRKKVKEGVVIWKCVKDDCVVLMYENRTSKELNIHMTVTTSTTAKHPKFQRMSPGTQWIWMDYFKYRSKNSIKIHPKSRCIIGTVWFDPWLMKFLTSDTVDCELVVEIVEKGTNEEKPFYEPIPITV
ncbi:unnamed protein product [Caenorhabditis brenneri]